MSIDKRKGGKYRVRYKDPDGNWKAKIKPTLKEAKAFEAEQIVGVQTGTWVDVSNGITVADYSRRYLLSRPHRPSSARRMKIYVEKHIAGTPLGGRPMVKIRPSEIQAWVTERGKVLSPGTLRHLVNLLRSIYNSAVLDRVVAANPVTTRIQLPKASKDRITPLTVDQVRKLAEKMPDRLQAAVVVQAGLGLRVAELLALRVEDVNFLGRIARVEHQMDQFSRDLLPTKTPRSRRSIPMPDVVINTLAAHIEAFPPVDGYLFTYNGKPYLQATHRHTLKRAVRASGLPPETSSHDLRHHYASVLLAAGESVVAVAERLGHENATLVLQVYGHLMPDGEDRTRKAVDAAWNSDKTRTESEEKESDLGG